MKSLITRVLSALVAVAGILALYYFFQDFGLNLLVLLAVVLSSFEAAHILFSKKMPNILKYLFYFLNIAIFAIASIYPIHGGLALGLGSIVFASLALVIQSSFSELSDTRDLIAKGLLGFIYLGILPSFAWRLLNLPHGFWWFTFLLSVVFSGDIGAYIFGSLWGTTKLLPKVSPKKSLQGSIGGLIGSASAAIVCCWFFNFVNWQSLIFLALIAGLSGQLGDFFESLLKRVADIKDSGHIMPGHGGALDRIDGVLFASPVIYFGALILENLI